jgi:SpoVK/Ycf46/Vps4 family AAA+-type ATPase
MDTVKLRGRLTALNLDKDSNAEDLAVALQDKFPEYARLKLAPLTRKISQLLPAPPAKESLPILISARNSASDEAQKTSDGDIPLPKKTRKIPFSAPRPSERLEDVCGLEANLMNLLKDLVVMPLRYPEIYSRLLGGNAACAGLLLCGAPGVGKTLIARALAGETGASFFSLNATEVVAGVSGEAESRLRDLFESAKNSAPSHSSR